MAELHFETVIQRPIEDVFALIADLPGYGKWLSSSSLYASVVHISDDPIKLGTKYVDSGKTTRMVGAVTVFEPPKRIHFRQSTTSLFGTLDVEAQYTLTSTDDGTRVARHMVIRPSGGFQFLQGFLLGSIRKESERILAAMKVWLEKDTEG